MPKLKLDTVKAKCPKLVILSIAVIKYINMLLKSDQMFQNTVLSGIEVDSIV
jgi:hypothetical protein